MSSRRNVIIVGAVTAILFGVIMTAIRAASGNSNLTWVFCGLGFAFLVNILLVVFIEKMREGRQHAQALAIGAVIGGIPITLLPVNDTVSQLAFGVAGALASYAALIRWATNAGQAVHSREYRQLNRAIYGLPESDRTPVAAIPAAYRRTSGMSAPHLVTLWLNEKFYGDTYPDQEELWEAWKKVEKVPFRDISRKPRGIYDWWNLARITHAIMQDGDTPTLTALRTKLEAVFRIRRPFDVSVQLIESAGYAEGVRLLQSDMPDEYLKALSV